VYGRVGSLVGSFGFLIVSVIAVPDVEYTHPYYIGAVVLAGVFGRIMGVMIAKKSNEII
jgi:hypothetical protein